MGQYQQWLHYQEIDRRLSSQVEALEAEIAQLQEYLDRLEQKQQEGDSFSDNPIMQTLIAHLSASQTPPKKSSKSIHESNHASVVDVSLSEPGDSISPALLNWGGLPNFGLQEIEEPFPIAEQAQPPINHSEIELLPEDMMAFFDGHEQTDPQVELPWWLRKITIASKDELAGRPIDQNSIRTNRLVQRWIERWGRQPSSVLQSTENNGEDACE